MRPPHRDIVAVDGEAEGPEGAVRLAAVHIQRSSMDAELARFSRYLTRGLRRVDLEGPAKLAEWVRARTWYRRETPGVEILQGPFTTLRTKSGDCDDLVVLWASLAQSIGLQCVLAGVRKEGDTHFCHAIGYCPPQRLFYELTCDQAYGGSCVRVVQTALPAGYEAVYWCTLTDRFVRASGRPDGKWSKDVQRAMLTPQRKRILVSAAATAIGLLLWRNAA